MLDKAMRLANRRVHAAAQSESRRGMGTTLTCAAVLDDKAYLAHVGDSRAYLVRRGTIYQLTKDHSWVEEQLEKGLLTPEEAESHEWRNLVTRVLGTRPQVVPDLVETDLQPGDVLVLASDGLHGQVKPEEILTELKRTRDRQHVIEYLIGLANERGGPDNITCVVVEVPA
jgi:protein phosphatase